MNASQQTLKLVENIFKQSLHVQQEREQIHQLNSDLVDEIETTYNLTWMIRNQRYLFDKLNINGEEHLDMVEELNQMENIKFIKGYQKFGSNEIFISKVLEHLRSNPKSVSYLIFCAEKACPGFLDPLCKIILSTVYGHCRLESDRIAIVDLMEELLEIYLNFHDNARRQIHSKNSSFSLVYRYFCDELPELKTFYKLALYQPIMQVLSEDSFYLDSNSERAASRFDSCERRKHFGTENTPEFHENLIKYKKWTINKLKMFIQNFINSLKANIFALPQSLAMLIIRIYSKLLQQLDFKLVYAICIDLVFCYLICPAIQNPDLFGVIDLHVNEIAHYNLLQCAEAIQRLALSKWEQTVANEIYNLFDKDCLSFVIDHILEIFNNVSLPKAIETEIIPYFLISDFELRLLLAYIKMFLTDNEQDPNNPLDVYFKKIPNSLIEFEIETNKLKPSNQPQSNRKTKSNENLQSTTFNSGLTEVDIHSIINSKDEDFVSTYKLLYQSRQIFQIMIENANQPTIGMMKEKDFYSKIVGYDLSNDVDSPIHEAIESICLEDGSLKHLENNNSNSNNFNSLLLLENDSPKFDKGISCNSDSANVDDFNLYHNRQLGCSFKEDLSQSITSLPSLVAKDTTNYLSDVFNSGLQTNFPESKPISDTKVNQHGSANLIDITDDSDELARSVGTQEQGIFFSEMNDNSQPRSSSRRNSGNKKSFFSLSNFKNIKDKVKNISLKDTGATSKPMMRQPDSMQTYRLVRNNPENLNSSNILVDLYSTERFDIQNVKSKTNEILEKYKSNKSTTTEELVSLEPITNTVDETDEPISLIPVDDHMDHTVQINLEHVKCKFRKLMCLINITSTAQSYRFLNIGKRNNFIMILKILLSQMRSMDVQHRNIEEVSNSVLIIDMIRVLDRLSDQDFTQIFTEIEHEQKNFHLYELYLTKSKQKLQFHLHLIRSKQLILRREQDITNFIIISFMIQQLFESKDSLIQQLKTKIINPAMLPDEKVHLVERTIQTLIDSNEFNCLTEEQYSLARYIIERHLIGRIYINVFYANGDIDKMRDQILFKQIGTISRTITPSSQLLKIPAKYSSTAPWLSAQAELLSLSAYKTARDKVQCIRRCCAHIITLLSTSDNTIPSADDLLPVLIFVTIKANPMSILSTIQYVNSFHSKDMFGEEAYYWTQFCSVVEFIKTILTTTTTNNNNNNE
ncbi:hypothetical protein RDWZM_002561 [Blomia tropicalis]|uniref:Receptor-mediated endocytosis protein 6 homolog n=1 Tax=Blomia tropicalis TaxID=40697 RepID=A0A9Q0RRQ8_BLOTA|nr:hypothetical protein RDWZM_002561 [Blomia tropicalis]